jgi:phosphoglycerol transferase MdoB-like AlkP superfamily enzyme
LLVKGRVAGEVQVETTTQTIITIALNFSCLLSLFSPFVRISIAFILNRHSLHSSMARIMMPIGIKGIHIACILNGEEFHLLGSFLTGNLPGHLLSLEETFSFQVVQLVHHRLSLLTLAFLEIPAAHLARRSNRKDLEEEDGTLAIQVYSSSSNSLDLQPSAGCRHPHGPLEVPEE